MTPVATGTVTITASTAEGASDSCTVMVLDHERKFYGYDELNTRWISFDETTGEVTTLREDAEGEAKITASVLAGETLYSYDAEGDVYKRQVADWAEAPVAWAVKEAILEGYPGSYLLPRGSATRAQAAAIFCRYGQL